MIKIRIAFIGSQSSGKTLSMVYYAYAKHLQGYDIYSNLKLNFPFKIFTQKELIEYTKNQKQFNKSVFLIDEAHLFFDSRSGMSNKNKVMSYFITQTSKRDCELYVTTQRFNQLDLRFRENCDYNIYCDRHLKIKDEYFIIPKTMKRKLTDYFNQRLYIINVIYDNQEQNLNSINKVYIKASPIFNLYDTKELIAFN